MGLFNFLFKRKKPNKKLKIGLALSGGGAKGVCHIGVLRAFEENGIKFDYIAGTSAGSLIGCAIAAGKNSFELEEIANSVKESDIRTSKILFMPSRTTGLENLVKNAIGGDKEFSDLKTKFFAVSTCLNTGKEKVFSSGNVAKCVASSCTFPGFFIPVEIDGKNYVDGGILNNIPTSVLRDQFCDVIIAVDLGASKEVGTDSIKTVDVLLTSYKIMASISSNFSKQLADVVIKPDLSKFRTTKLNDTKAIIEEGYVSAKEAMPQILHILKTKKPVNKRKLIKKHKIEQRKHKKQMKMRAKFNVYKKEEK